MVKRRQHFIMEAQLFLTHKDVIQELQDTYSQATRLSICICNKEGRLMTEMSGEFQPSESFTGIRTEIEAVMQGQIPILIGLRNPTLYDNWIPGLKFISVPIVVGGKPLYFLFAGFVILEGAKEQIRLEAAGLTPRFKQFMQEAVSHTPETDSDSAEARRLKVGKLAKAISVILEQGNAGFAVNERVRQFHQDLNKAGNSRMFPKDKLREVFSKSPLGEIVGIALEKTPGELEITDAVGPGSQKIIGGRFRTGEGFLGHAMLNERDSEWNGIQQDPRALFFRQAGITDLETIYCFPILSGTRITGIIFCLSKYPSLIHNHILDLEKMYFSWVASYVGNELAYRQLEKQLGRIKPLLDAAQFLNALSDIKRMALTLVEIALNMAEQPLGALVVQQEDNSSQLHILARGIEQDRADQMVQEIVDLYFSETSDTAHIPYIHSTEKGTWILELPISYDHKIRAVLLVELKHECLAEENREILLPLGTVYALSLKSFYARDQIQEMVDYTARLLSEIMAEFRPAEGHTARRMESLASGYAGWSGISETEGKKLARAALLSSWELAALEKFRYFPEELMIIREWKEQTLPAGSIKYSREAQILAVIATYLQNNEALASLEIVPGVEQTISNSFRSFIMNEQTLESSVTISPVTIGQTSAPGAAFGEEAVEEAISKLGLSAREKEVLRLVIKASSNKGIASTLFISEHTVKNHLSNIFQKMGVNDRTQAIAAVFKLL